MAWPKSKPDAARFQELRGTEPRHIKYQFSCRCFLARRRGAYRL
jgi:hypothetical protein